MNNKYQYICVTVIFVVLDGTVSLQPDHLLDRLNNTITATTWFDQFINFNKTICNLI